VNDSVIAFSEKTRLINFNECGFETDIKNTTFLIANKDVVLFDTIYFKNISIENCNPVFHFENVTDVYINNLLCEELNYTASKLFKFVNISRIFMDKITFK